MQKSQKEPAGNYGLLFQPFSFYLAENRSKKFGDRLAGGCQRVMLEGDGCIAGMQGLCFVVRSYDRNGTKSRHVERYFWHPKNVK